MKIKFEAAFGIVDSNMDIANWFFAKLQSRELIYIFCGSGENRGDEYVIKDERILMVFGQFANEFKSKSIIEGIADLDNGRRFEGQLLKDREGEMGIPFGFGEMYDDDGILVYKGIMINWKRFGYGVNYHDNGEIEYEGYWCDDNRFGKGKVYDRRGRLIKECSWYNKNEIDIDNYEGDGSNLRTDVKSIVLTDDCKLNKFDISLFLLLESLIIGDNNLLTVYTFQIEGLSKLKSIRIGKNSFTQKKNSYGYNESKSFHILNCESLESIEIGEYSFSDFAGPIELKNLPKLQSIIFGSFHNYSYNFCNNSLDISGMYTIVRYYTYRLSRSEVCLYRKWIILSLQHLENDRNNLIRSFGSLRILRNIGDWKLLL